MDINISVAGKIATVADSASIVCGNSDYRLVFTFDAEWQNEIVKTCRFITAPGVYTDVVFEGTVCNIPVISSGEALVVGVFAGNLRTSTHAGIRLIDSITGEDGAPQPINPDAYYQAIVLVNQAVADAQLAVEEAEEAVSDADQALQAATILLESFNDDLGEGHQLQAALQESINSGALILSGLQEKVPQAEAAHEALADPVTGSIPAAEAAHEALADPTTGSIPAAEAAHEALADPTTGSIKSAEDAKSALDGSVATAGNSKSALDGSIFTAQGLQTALADPTTGSIKRATDAHALLADPATGSIKLATDAEDDLEADILAAGVAEAALEDAIANGDLNAIKLYASNIMQQIQALMRVYAQMNIFQEATANAIDYGIISLPKNAANGPGKVTIEGNTSSNIVTNVDFSAGTTGWTPSKATLSVSNKILSCVGDGSAAVVATYPVNTPVSNGNVYYLSLRARVTNASCSSIKLWFRGATVVSQQLTPTQNQWYTLSAVHTATGASTYALLLEHSYADASTANGKVMEVDGNFGVETYNLTSIFGTGFEPSLADADKLYSAGFFSGTASVDGTGRIRSVSRNIFDGQLELGGYLTTDGGLFTATDRIRNKNKYILIKPSTQYIGSTGVNYFWYDRNKNFISNTGYNSGAMTSPADAKYLNIVVESTNLTLLLQIEQSAATTPYEAHRRAELYLNGGTLYSVPTAKDRIESDSGALRKIQRVQKTTLTADNITGVTNMTNVQLVNLSISGRAASNASGLPQGKTRVPGYTEIGTITRDTAGNDKMFYTYNALIDLVVALGTYANVTAAKAALTGLVVYSELATPVIAPVQTTGQFVTYPSGTVYNEPFKADACVYTTLASILDTTRPIAELERLYKLDPLTGSPTELPVTTAVVAANGLTFTHPSATAGDILALTYRFDYAAPVPKTTVTYYDSNVVEEDIAVPGSFFKVTHRVNNGTVEHVKTAV